MPASSSASRPAIRALVPYEPGKPAEELRAALPEAETYLDRLAAEAEDEAAQNAAHPERLVDLLRHTRALSAV